MERKKIDRLYQEKFKDFEVAPPDDVWSKIEAQLDQKEDKKKKTIPFWWKLAGVAVLFLGGIMLYQNLNTSKSLNPIVNPENEQNPIVLDNQKNIEKPTQESVYDTNGDFTDSENMPNENQVVGQTNDTESSENPIKRKTEKATQKTTIKKEKLISGSYEKTGLTDNKPVKDDSKEQNIKSENKQNAEIDRNVLTQNHGRNLQKGKTKSEPILENIENNSLAAAEEQQEKNALEELLKEKEKVTKEEKLNRWQVSAALAPVYFNSFSDNSPIDSQFDGNSKDFDPSASYGVGVQYAVNKKLSVRTGINKLSFSQNTYDIVYYADLKGLDIQNINPSGNGAITVSNKSDISSDALILSNDINKSDGYLNQRIGFVEIPVEVSYRFIDKKFGVKLIGGMSTMFLAENEIRVKSSGFNNEIGEANNLNDVHFSTNIGLGFEYSFWQSFSVGFEPMFKYQLNTFTKNNNNGDFKPYFIGLYSGISYRF